MEPLEERQMLSVSPGFEATHFDALKADYPALATNFASFEQYSGNTANLTVIKASDFDLMDLYNKLQDTSGLTANELIVIQMDQDLVIDLPMAIGFSGTSTMTFSFVTWGEGTLEMSSASNVRHFTVDNGKVQFGGVDFTNSETAGGGFAITNNSVVNFEAVSFAGCVATQGGAISMTNSTVTVSRTSFEGNRATNGGGGAIYQNVGTLNVSNTLFAGNTASTQGGAVHATGSNLDISVVSCTVANNTGSGTNDAAIYLSGTNNVGTRSVYNTIFMSNSGGRDLYMSVNGIRNIGNTLRTGSFNVGSTGVNYPGFNEQVSVAALALDPVTFQPRFDSVAIDRIDNPNQYLPGATTGKDLDGNARVFNGKMDVGAFESSFETSLVAVTDLAAAPLVTAENINGGNFVSKITFTTPYVGITTLYYISESALETAGYADIDAALAALESGNTTGWTAVSAGAIVTSAGISSYDYLHQIPTVITPGTSVYFVCVSRDGSAAAASDATELSIPNLYDQEEAHDFDGRNILAVTNNGNGTVTLSWEDCYGPNTYMQMTEAVPQYWDAQAGAWKNLSNVTLGLGTVKGLENVPISATATLPALPAGTAKFRAVYYNTDWNVVAGELEVEVVVTIKLAAPAGRVAPPQEGKVTVTWDAVPGAIGYIVQWRRTGATDWDNSGTITGNSFTFEDYAGSPLANGERYRVQVRAIAADTQYNSDWTGYLGPQGATSDGHLYGIPRLLKPTLNVTYTDNKTFEVVVGTTSASNFAGFEVQWRIKGSEDAWTDVSVGSGTNITTTITTLEVNQDVEIRVRAKSSLDTYVPNSVYSDWATATGEATAELLSSGTAVLTLVDKTSTTVTVTYAQDVNAGAGPRSFIVYKGDDPTPMQDQWMAGWRYTGSDTAQGPLGSEYWNPDNWGWNASDIVPNEIWGAGNPDWFFWVEVDDSNPALWNMRYTGLEPGTTYTFVYEFANPNEGYAPIVNRITVTTEAEVTEPLAVPANRKVTEWTENSITVTWDAVEGAVGYMVQWRKSGETGTGYGGTVWANQSGLITDTSFTIEKYIGSGQVGSQDVIKPSAPTTLSDLESGVGYRIQIIAIAADSQYNSPWSANVGPEGTGVAGADNVYGVTKLNKPTLDVTSTATGFEVVLTDTLNTATTNWLNGNTVAVCSGYEVQWKLAGDSEWQTITAADGKYTIEASANVEVRARALTAWSPANLLVADWINSAWATATGVSENAALDAPVVTLGDVGKDVAGNDSWVEIHWNIVSGATGYEVHFFKGTNVNDGAGEWDSRGGPITFTKNSDGVWVGKGTGSPDNGWNNQMPILTESEGVLTMRCNTVFNGEKHEFYVIALAEEGGINSDASNHVVKGSQLAEPGVNVNPHNWFGSDPILTEISATSPTPGSLTVSYTNYDAWTQPWYLPNKPTGVSSVVQIATNNTFTVGLQTKDVANGTWDAAFNDLVGGTYYVRVMYVTDDPDFFDSNWSPTQTVIVADIPYTANPDIIDLNAITPVFDGTNWTFTFNVADLLVNDTYPGKQEGNLPPDAWYSDEVTQAVMNGILDISKMEVDGSITFVWKDMAFDGSLTFEYQIGDGAARSEWVNVEIILPSSELFTVVTTSDDLTGTPNGTDLSLRQAIGLANAGQTSVIVFAPDLAGETISLVHGQMTITSDVVIVGLGADLLTISGSGKSRIFNITTGNVEINGLSLTDGKTDRGGAIYQLGGNLTINQVVFADNVADYYGGAFYQYAGTSKITADFVGNSAKTGGGAICLANTADALIIDSEFRINKVLEDDLGGGGIYICNSVNVSIEGTVFVANEATNGAGIFISNCVTTTVTDSTFSLNEAKSGGGIYLTVGTLTVDGKTEFANNEADRGGGIYQKSGTLTVKGQTEFTHNIAAFYGGGFYQSGGTSKITAVFADNEAETGGAAVTLSDVAVAKIIDSEFRHNVVSDASDLGGGGIYLCNTAVLTIADTRFEINEAGRGGAIFQKSGTLTADRLNFTGNIATYSGGGFYQFGGKSEISAVTFADNKANTSGAGVALANTALAEIIDANFIGNIVDSSSEIGGGGIYLCNSVKAIITAPLFEANEAPNGGGLYMTGAAAVDLIVEKFTGNIATRGSAVAKLGGGKLTFQRGSSLPAKVIDAGITRYLNDDDAWFD